MSFWNAHGYLPTRVIFFVDIRNQSIEFQRPHLYMQRIYFASENVPFSAETLGYSQENKTTCTDEVEVSTQNCSWCATQVTKDYSSELCQSPAAGEAHAFSYTYDEYWKYGGFNCKQLLQDEFFSAYVWNDLPSSTDLLTRSFIVDKFTSDRPRL